MRSVPVEACSEGAETSDVDFQRAPSVQRDTESFAKRREVFLCEILLPTRHAVCPYVGRLAPARHARKDWAMQASCRIDGGQQAPHQVVLEEAYALRLDVLRRGHMPNTRSYIFDVQTIRTGRAT